MERCTACGPVFDSFPYARSFLELVPVEQYADPETSGNRAMSIDSSLLVRQAFNSSELERGSNRGLGALALETADISNVEVEKPLEIIDVAMTRYRRQQPNCLAIGITNGVRGAVVGSVFGLAMGLSTAVQSGYRGTAAASFAGQGALRNAAGFGAWTALYGFSRCGLIRIRQRNDILNSAIAGAFTGGVLTLISVRGHWRYYQSSILTNAGGSAMVAVMFDALNYI